MVTPDAKRKAVAHACTVHAVSQRRACLALTIDRSTVRYTSTRPDDAVLREAMKAVAGERRRFGYRRIHIMLDRHTGRWPGMRRCLRPTSTKSGSRFAAHTAAK